MLTITTNEASACKKKIKRKDGGKKKVKAEIPR